MLRFDGFLQAHQLYIYSLFGMAKARALEIEEGGERGRDRKKEWKKKEANNTLEMSVSMG